MTAVRSAFTRPVVLAGFVLWTVAFRMPGTVSAADDKPTREQLDFFEQRIRPVLIEHCYECHAGDTEKRRKGGLDLSFRGGLIQGGDSGPAIVPGKPNASLLLDALNYQSLEMPPKGKLPDQVVEDFARWISIGAPDPRRRARGAGDENSGNNSAYPVDASELWSFQPLREAPIPNVQDVDWSRNDIDRFVRSKLDSAGLPPAPPARDAVLLRRLHLVLTGLPPSPSELTAFLAAAEGERGQVIEDVVDRLLRSPAFGDKWARHWLDLTAYADTIGVGRTIPALEAWRYRDYVIAAFNDDKPLPEFISQQIAGDIHTPAAPGIPEGPLPTAESIVATGFLAIGPWELVGGDKEQLRMDVVDRQVNRIGKAFLGMTLECARCHDHKFDPISQSDYYAVAGILKSTVTLNGRINGVFSDINHIPLPESADELLARAERAKMWQAEVAEQTQQRDDAETKLKELKTRIAPLQKEIADSATNEDHSAKSQKLKTLEGERDATSARIGQLNSRLGVLKYIRRHRTRSLAMAVMDTPEPLDAYVNIRGSAHQRGDLVPRGFPKQIAPSDKPAFTRGSSGRVQLAAWIADKRNPLTARVQVNRVWHHLFGQGLVRSVDNFGATGELPSHPELLDHLATDFMAHGWSTKTLIRRIVLSRTWQQASANPAAMHAGVANRDPENRLLWRANRHRLDAETIRDAMLFVSGKLDPARGGPCLPVDVPGNLNSGSTGSLKDDIRLPDTLRYRRTIYLPQKRKGPFDALDFISVFDLPDNNHETGRRSITSVPTQALYLANSGFVQECARAFAERVAGKPDRERVAAVYRAAYSRPPTDTEIDQALAFVRQLTAGVRATENADADDASIDREAWARFCQSILMANEFLFRS